VTFVGHFRETRAGDLDRLVSTLFPIVYVGFLFGLMREVGDGPTGARLLAISVVAAKASDIGGWVVGKSIGRHKMIPSVSPGKTWEGTVGGLAFSVGSAWILTRVLDFHAHPVSTDAQAALYALSLGVAATVAGVTQSALKRRCGVKDSSTLLPEMGGVLDMIDSLLLAAPVAWLWLLLR
jgi:phosphatidate cytidylyltransferase